MEKVGFTAENAESAEKQDAFPRLFLIVNCECGRFLRPAITLPNWPVFPSSAVQISRH
jgi:hypothetical protein